MVGQGHCLPLKHTVLHPSGASCYKINVTNSGFLANYVDDSFGDPSVGITG